MSKQENKFKSYDAPRIKVVSFKIEHGFAGSYTNENSQNNDPSLEEVVGGSSLTGYFQ